jgi:hypothetical protein
VTGRWRLGRASAGAVVDAEADVSIDLGTGTVTFGEARRDITRSAGLDDEQRRAGGAASASAEGWRGSPVRAMCVATCPSESAVRGRAGSAAGERDGRQEPQGGHQRHPEDDCRVGIGTEVEEGQASDETS